MNRLISYVQNRKGVRVFRVPRRWATSHLASVHGRARREAGQFEVYLSYRIASQPHLSDVDNLLKEKDGDELEEKQRITPGPDLL